MYSSRRIGLDSKNMKSISKSTIIIIVVCIVLAIVYFYIQGGNSTSSNSLLEGTNADGTAVGLAELSLLNQINSIRLDTSIFTNSVYQSLKDYSVAIPPQNVGRPNPFAPIPGVTNMSAAEAAAASARR